jgi:SAM-dependent methyltransferase
MDILLGCGHSRQRMISPIRKEWDGLVTVDFNKDCKPDVQWDLNMIPLPFPDDSADEIHAYNVLEHCGIQGDFKFFFAQFEDFWRILRPNGFLCFTCPTSNDVWTWGDPGHTRIINHGTITFLDQRAYEQVGTARTDYRFCYKGNLRKYYCNIDEQSKTFYVVLQAIKGAL